nr:uncharacterized protein LOC109428975 [Aedes albopictus]
MGSFSLMVVGLFYIAVIVLPNAAHGHRREGGGGGTAGGAGTSALTTTVQTSNISSPVLRIATTTAAARSTTFRTTQPNLSTTLHPLDVRKRKVTIKFLINWTSELFASYGIYNHRVDSLLIKKTNIAKRRVCLVSIGS